MKVVYKNGSFIPQEPIELNEDQEVDIYIPYLEFSKNLEKLKDLFKQNDPYKGNTDEEITELLRKERDEWWDKKYADKFGY